MEILNLSNAVIAVGRVDVAQALASDRDTLITGDEVSRVFTNIELMSVVSAPRPASSAGPRGLARRSLGARGGGVFAFMSLHGVFFKIGRFAALPCSRQFGIGCDDLEVDPVTGLLQFGTVAPSSTTESTDETQFWQTVPNSAFECGMRRGHLVTRVDQVRVTSSNFGEIQLFLRNRSDVMVEYCTPTYYTLVQKAELLPRLTHVCLRLGQALDEPVFNYADLHEVGWSCRWVVLWETKSQFSHFDFDHTSLYFVCDDLDPVHVLSGCDRKTCSASPRHTRSSTNRQNSTRKRCSRD